MDIKIKIGTVEKESAEILVFYLYEDVKTIGGPIAYCDKALNSTISELIKKKEFAGKLNKTTVLPTYGRLHAKRIMLVGLGMKKDVTPDKIRQAAGVTASTVRDMGINEATCVMDSIEIPTPPSSEWYQAYVEGSMLALYKFQKYKQVPPEEQKELKTFTLLFSNKETSKSAHDAVKNGSIIADAVYFARDLVNTPAQDKTPTILADAAKKMAS